jgi:hypothetical protein
MSIFLSLLYREIAPDAEDVDVDVRIRRGDAVSPVCMLIFVLYGAILFPDDGTVGVRRRPGDPVVFACICTPEEPVCMSLRMSTSLLFCRGEITCVLLGETPCVLLLLLSACCEDEDAEF